MPPLAGVAVNVTDVFAQIDAAPLELVMLTDGVTVGVTVSVIVLLLAVVVVRQDVLLVMVHVIASLLTRDEVEYVLLVAPDMAVPFFFHWYVGVVPPLVGVAVKVTDVPEQLDEAPVIATEGVTLFTTAV